MNTNSENLSKALKDLNLLVSRFESNSKIEAIELDLALSKTRQIYDCLLYLSCSVAEKKEVKPDNITLTTLIEKVNESENIQVGHSVRKEEPVVLNTNSKGDVEKEPELVENADTTEPIIELEEYSEKEQLEKIEAAAEQIVAKERSQETKHKTAEDILAEKFKRNEPLINDVLARAGKRDVSSILQAKPVKSIESAIGINERFEFVRELFNGDNATYLKTLRILDSSANFNEAFNYINQTFSWDYDSNTVHKLLDLVRRRYITD